MVIKLVIMEQKTIKLDFLDDEAIAVITLNRPDALNALNEQLASDFVRAIGDVQGKEGTTRAVVITGSGKAFSAGGDLGAFKQATDPGQFLHALARNFHEGIKIMRRIDAPVIAAINGACMGVGLSLACACDVRLSSSLAKYRVAFTGVGLTPDSGMPFYLPRIVGVPAATKLMLFNEVLDAEKALEIGLVDKIVDGDSLVDEAIGQARVLASMPTKALGMVKRLIEEAFSCGLDAHLDKELDCIHDAAKTSDFKEGIAAFFERRKPEFTGS